MNLLPAFIHRRIGHNPNLVKIVDNIGWLFIDKILRIVLGLFVNIWIARYLGPKKYGVLNYTIAFVSLFNAVATVGLQGIVVRDLINTPNDKDATTIMGTAFLLQIIGAITAMALMLSIITWLHPDNMRTRAMVAIMGSALVFQSSAIIRYWFESQVQSRFVVWVENSVFIIIAALKVGLVLYSAKLIYFAWVVLIEAVFIAVGLFSIYAGRGKKIRNWQFSFARAKRLLYDSWPMILSGIAVIIYMRIDQIMLGKMVGQKEVGLYSAALKISEVWYMIPTILSISFFPTIIEARNKNKSLYMSYIQRLLYLVVALSFSIALVITFTAHWLTEFLFGSNFINAAPVLMTHIWAGLFVFVGVVGGKWYIAENLQRLSLYRTSIGALINIILNIILMPTMGALGAAISTVISYCFAAYILDATSVKTRHLFHAKTRALICWPYWLLKRI